jgi:hypothetical protein
LRNVSVPASVAAEMAMPLILNDPLTTTDGTSMSSAVVPDAGIVTLCSFASALRGAVAGCPDA